ncbi:NAD(P)-dependent oxidoreductase [Streptomyces luomodiensis]|uniref:NAD(P)-dependent oxidoreductase n=1 Tax=Streptomyces luomodiensis TaxID=3026192 RepID=A0ABY9VAX3_9ACTN|nr:NAD(P)-dependent oxidoreductase [Streptomyces sp. SCA4-21]WNF01146.1 NAD(P)-dependent oxidoreductase [Streptomyces sp. SCA4-21]
MRIAYWAGIPLARQLITASLQSVEGADVLVVDTLPALLDALPEVDALVLSDCPVSEAVEIGRRLRSPDNRVRWMHFITAGREKFLKAGIPSGIRVTDPDGAIAPTVAEHALALLLALGRQLPACAASTGRGEWDRSMAVRARSIEGQSLLVVGYGHVGRQVARRAAAFGARITVVTRTPRHDDVASDIRPLSALEEALSTADAIVVTIALTEQTRHLIGARLFAAVKSGALLVNVARGDVIDQSALAAALHAGRIAAAGLDVTEPEPLPTGDPLWGAPNLLVSGHFAGAGSAPSVERLAQGVVAHAARFVASSGSEV